MLLSEYLLIAIIPLNLLRLFLDYTGRDGWTTTLGLTLLIYTFIIAVAAAHGQFVILGVLLAMLTGELLIFSPLGNN